MTRDKKYHRKLYLIMRSATTKLKGRPNWKLLVYSLQMKLVTSAAKYTDGTSAFIDTMKLVSPYNFQ